MNYLQIRIFLLSMGLFLTLLWKLNLLQSTQLLVKTYIRGNTFLLIRHLLERNLPFCLHLLLLICLFTEIPVKNDFPRFWNTALLLTLGSWLTHLGLWNANSD